MFDWLSGSDGYREPAGCIIEVDGTTIEHLYGFVSNVSVSTSRTEPTTATINFEAPVDESGYWLVQDDPTIRTGNSIKIEASFGDATEEVFRGFILQVSPSYPADRGQSKVTLTCRDETILLDQGHERRVWGDTAPTTDGLIVAELAQNSGLTPSPLNGQGMEGIEVAQNGSDIQFLKDRATANSYEFYTRGGELYFGPMQLAAEPQPTIMVYAGRKTNCLGFDVNDDSHKADSLSFDIAPETGAETESETLSPDLDILGTRPATGEGSAAGANHWRMSRTNTPRANEARSRAQGLVNTESMRVNATGELDGSLYGHVLRFGEPVGVSGVGSEFGGTYYVDKITHDFTPQKYVQKFTLIRNGLGDDLEASGGLLDAVMG